VKFTKTASLRQKMMMMVSAACMTIVAFTAIVIWLQLQAIDRGARTEAHNLARSVAYSIGQQHGPLQPFVQGLVKLYKRDMIVVDAHKVGLADADPKEVGDIYRADTANEVGRTVADGQVRTFIEQNEEHPQGALHLVVPLHEGGHATGPIVGAVILEYTRTRAELLAASLTPMVTVGVVGLACVLLVGIFGFRLVHSIALRLRNVQVGVERMSRGDFAARLATDASDEIGQLKAAFNNMARDLQTSRDELLVRIQSERKAAQQVEYLAYHDKLTGLCNRSMFSRLLEQSLAESRRYARPLAVMFVDLDHFKNINDTLGHEAGDTLLHEVAQRLKSCMRDSDTVARLGGDEFVVLLPCANDRDGVAAVAQKIIGVLAQPFAIAGQEFRVTASVGISCYPDDGNDEPTLMKHADIAMYQAKEEGRNSFMFYSPAMNRHSIERLAFESSLRVALEAQQFHIHYQPKVDCRTGRMTGVEALLRWRHPELGAVSPTKFIPVAEEMGLIVPLGRWVLQTVCRQHMAWVRQGLPPVRVAVNLSARQFSDDGLLGDVTSILAEMGMNPAHLELEITESMLMSQPEKARQVLEAFKRLGIWLSVDDFGTGYSSLSNLKRFPIDTIKVDRSFVRDLPTNQEDQAITDAIIGMAKTLNMSVVAEGVETHGQAQFLREHGCDEIQGFYFSRPVAPDAIADMLRVNPEAILHGSDVVRPEGTQHADSAFMADS
jgi:diguanylate cyclase (GGDEF)-like protein